MIEDGYVRLTVGPRENGHRLAIDVLFRSAAAALDSRVIGVVLSGTRDDGSAGLAVIKATGGATIVHDPRDAPYAGMPASAIANVAVDAIVPAALVGSTIAAMVKGERPPPPASSENPGPDPESPDDPPDPVTVVCPDCGGVLTERAEAGVFQWECRVGHRYSPDTLLDAQADDVESALWAGIRALEDRVALLERIAHEADERAQDGSARRFLRQSQAASEQAGTVRWALAGAAGTTRRRVPDTDEEERVRDPESAGREEGDA